MADAVYKFNKTNYPIDFEELEIELNNSGITSASLRGVSSLNETDPVKNLSVTWNSTLSDSAPDDEGTMDTVVNDHNGGSLPIFKKQLCQQVDDYACKRFAGVLTYEYTASSGKFFSLTLTAQMHITNLYTNKANLTYTFKVFTKDNSGSHTVADATDMTNFYLAMNNAYVTEMNLIETTKTNIDGAADAAAAQTAADAYLDL